MAALENSQRNIFVILEDFLIKVASLDIFEVLIYNYKLKDEFMSGLSCDFIPIIDELFFEVQALLLEYKKKANSFEGKSSELCLYSSLGENFDSSHVPEDQKLPEGNTDDGADVNSVDVIPQSDLGDMPLFSPKSITEDNIDVDATDSLWSSDSKSADLIPNQLQLQDISNNSSESETCSSLQCLSCHKLFTPECKLNSNICKYCHERITKNSSHAVPSYSNNVNITKLSQEYPLDFRHSTEIRSLIEDALHVPKEESLRVDDKIATEPCAIVESSALEECPTILETNGSESESKSTFNLNDEICSEKTVIKETFSYIKEPGNKSFDELVESNYSSVDSNVADSSSNKANGTCKRTLNCDGGENLSDKSMEAFCNIAENGSVKSNEDLPKRALVNPVIINTIELMCEGGMGTSLPKSKAKKKIKRKERAETVDKELPEKVSVEPEPKENRDVTVGDSIKEDCWKLGKMKCLGSDVTPFICCEGCFFVFKDWEFYHKHVCNCVNPNDTHRSGDDEFLDEVIERSSSNGKDNEKADSASLMEPLSTVRKLSKNCGGCNDYKDLTSKIFVGNDASDVKGSKKLSSVITDYEILSRINRFACSICLEEYRSLDRIMYHLPRCVSGPYKCELCPSEYAYRRELNLHKKKKHRDAQSFICDECGVKFKFRTSLQKHKVNRHERQVDKETYSCPHCSLTFPKKIHLTNHCIKVHSLERKFLCQVCGKKFLSQNSLNSHLNCHDEAKNRFTCFHCSKTFLRKEKLLYHMRIHTGERPFECKSCGKSFICKTRLTEHLWRHGGNKRYACPHCPKKYAGRWDLKLHVRKKHGKTLSSADGPSTEESSVSIPESSLTNPRKVEEVPTVSSDKHESAQMLVVEEVHGKSVAPGTRDSDEAAPTVPSQGPTVVSPGILMPVQMPNTADYSLPLADLQSSQLIQLSSPSTSSYFPIQFQVSSAPHSLEVTSHPSIIFTSGVYLS